MEYELRWGGEPEDLLVTTSGKATLPELDAWVQAVLADPRFKPHLRVLVDHRRTQWDHLSSEDLRRRVDTLVRDADRIDRPRVAWVVSQPVAFGLGRMMQMLAEDRWNVEWRAFLDVDEARAWLRAAPA